MKRRTFLKFVSVMFLAPLGLFSLKGSKVEKVETLDHPYQAMWGKGSGTSGVIIQDWNEQGKKEVKEIELI